MLRLNDTPTVIRVECECGRRYLFTSSVIEDVMMFPDLGFCNCKCGNGLLDVSVKAYEELKEMAKDMKFYEGDDLQWLEVNVG